MPNITDSKSLKRATDLPIPVTVIAESRAIETPTGTIATTPDHQPNLVVVLITPIMAIVVRFMNQFLTTLVGLVGAGLTPAGSKVLQANDFFHLVLTCASLAIVGAGFGVIKDLVTIFGKLEGKYPLLTGNV